MPKKKVPKSNLNLTKSDKTFRQMSIMECFNKKCKNKSTFKFSSPTLVTNVAYEVNSEIEEPSHIDLDETIPYDCNLEQNNSKINVLSDVHIRHNETSKEINIHINREPQPSSTCDTKQIKSNCKSTQNEMQGLSNTTLKYLPDFQDNNKRPYQKENQTLSPKKMKVLPKPNITVGYISNTESSKERNGKELQKVITKTNVSPVGNKEVKTPRGISNVKSFKAKEGKQLQDKQLKTFIDLIKSVNKSGDLRNLLSIEECKTLNTFLQFDEKCQYSILKLYIWKKIWYNIFTFCKKANIEIADEKDVTDIFQCLASEGFVDTDYYKNYDNIQNLLENLNKKEIEILIKNLKIKHCTSKNENISKIIALMGKQQTIFGTYKDVVVSHIQTLMGFAFKLSNEKISIFNSIYTLATFTNPLFRNIQDYFHHVIYKGMVYPCTSIEQFLIFSSRIQFENYAEALGTYNQFDEIKSKGDKIEIWDIGRNIYEKLSNLEIEEPEKTTPHLYRYRAEYIYVKILTECCERIFTKANGFPKDVAAWLDFLIRTFPNSQYLGKWYHRLIRLYMNHMEPVDYEKASHLMIDALDRCKDDEISFHELANLGRKMNKSKKNKLKQIYHDKIAFLMPRIIKEKDIPTEHIDALTLPNISKSNRKLFAVKESSNDDITIKNVENVALFHYKQDGYEGFHCENSLMHALFMLFFWDIIYSPPRNVLAIFITSIQTAPLDIFTEYFYKNRKTSFEKRLLEIASKWTLEETVEYAINMYQNHSHEWSVFGPINDTVPDKKVVTDVITVIGQKLLCRIFERLAKDLKRFRSGMPDLFLYNTEEKKCKFVEVKSTHDRLATNQLLWLKYLKDNGADVAVSWVNSSKAKKSTKNPENSTED